MSEWYHPIMAHRPRLVLGLVAAVLLSALTLVAAASAPASVPPTAASGLAAQQDLTFERTMAEAKAAQAAYDGKSAGGRFLQRVENEYLLRVAAISTTTPGRGSAGWPCTLISTPGGITPPGASSEKTRTSGT